MNADYLPFLAIALSLLAVAIGVTVAIGASKRGGDGPANPTDPKE